MEGIIEAVLIIFGVFLYWKFVYYNHRTGKTSQFFLLVPAVISVCIGAYSFFIGRTIPKNIYVLYIILLVYYILGLINIFVASRKHKLMSKVDYTLTWFKNRFGKIFMYFMIVIGFPALFLSVLGTYWVFGAEHVYLWIMILIAWTWSGIKLFKNYVLR